MSIIGRVTLDEMGEIRILFQRKTALRELVHSLVKGTPSDLDSPLYERLLADLGVTCFKFDAWWAEMSKKYGWGLGSWEIDFSNGDIVEQ